MKNIKKKGRGRPKKVNVQKTNPNVRVRLKKMNELNFDEALFIPMKTNTIVDGLLSSEGGLMPGTSYIFAGSPGVGKSTVLMDWLAEFQKQGKETLFISGEMGKIDLYKYVERFPKFGSLPTLFLEEYLTTPKEAIENVLKRGFDVVLVDSWAEVTDLVSDQMGWTRKRVESWLLELLGKHNNGKNKAKKYTSFMLIQQKTKQEELAGSNKVKHMTTGSCYIKYEGSDREARFIEFKKNRRGGEDKVYFDLGKGGKVGYNYPEAD